MTLPRIPEPQSVSALTQTVWTQYWSQARAHMAEQYVAPARRFLKFLPERGRGLEVPMSGFGMLAQVVANAGHDITTIDIDPTVVETARRRVPGRHKVEQASAYDLPYGDLDFVASNGGLHHLDQLERACREIYGALTPGGLFYFEDANREHLDDVRQSNMMLPRARDLAVARHVHDLQTRDPEEFVCRYQQGMVFQGFFNTQLSLFLERVLTIRCMSYCAAWAPEELEAALETVGFSDVQWQETEGPIFRGYVKK